MSRWVWIALTGVVAAITIASGVLRCPAGAAPGAVEVAGADPRILAALLRQGQDAMRAESYKAARDAFVDALSVNRNHPRVLEGAGTAYLHLQDFARAKPVLEQAAEVSGPKGPTRSLVLNLSAVHVRQKNAMRAVKLARDYLTAHPDPVDEQVLNALGVALFQSDERARKAPLFRESAKFYEAASARLETKRPGMKRWGPEWLPQAEWAARDQRWKAQQADADRSYANLAARRNDLARVEKQLGNLNRGLGVRRRSPGELSTLRRRASDAAAAVEAAEREYDTALAGVERPKFPGSIEPVPMGAPAPPELAEPGGPGAGAPPRAAGPRPAVRIDVAKQPPANRRPVPPAAPEPAADIPGGAAEPAPRPRIVLYAAAFAVSPDLLVTAAPAVDGAGEMTVQSSEGIGLAVTLVRKDEGSGLALLRVEPEAPGAAGVRVLMPLPIADAFAAGVVSCVSFPSVNMFDPRPERIDGAAAARKADATDAWTVRLARHPRLAGAPLLSGGKVVGVALATRDSDPARVPAATLDDLRKLLANDAPPGGGAAQADASASVLQLTVVREGGD